MALEAGRLVDLLVLPGHVRAGCGNEVLHEVDGRERVAGRVEEDDEAVDLGRLIDRACGRGPCIDRLRELVRVRAVTVVREPRRGRRLRAGHAMVVRRHVADPRVIRAAVHALGQLDQGEAPVDGRRRHAAQPAAVPLGDFHRHDRPAVRGDGHAGELSGDLRDLELRWRQHAVVDRTGSAGRPGIAAGAAWSRWSGGTCRTRARDCREQSDHHEASERFRSAAGNV